jgi:hypothetical protein
MKKSFIVMICAAAVMLSVEQAKADQKYVQSAGSSVFTIDREAGTITRQIRSSIQGTPAQSETVSCKYGYIVTINGESTSTLDLLAPVNDLALKRLESVRKDCLEYSIQPRF